MSSDYLEDVENNDVVVLLTQFASGFAELTVIDLTTIASFPLDPNKLGVENAEKIASALLAWANHVKEVGLFKP
jgi:hypothetical protein